MKKTLIPALLAGAVLAVSPQAAMAAKKKEEAAVAAPDMSIVVANLEGALANAAANKAAVEGRKTYYKPQADQYQARAMQAQNQLKPLYEKFERDQQAPNPNRAALEQQAALIQQIEQKAQADLNEIMRPVAYSEAYVNEQIEAKLDGAVKAVMAARKARILLKPSSVYLLNDQTLDITKDVVAELDRVIPSVQFVPPPGWEPRQIREARAAQAAQQGQQPAPAARPAQPAGPQPEGR